MWTQTPRMSRAISGNKHGIPGDLDPLAWANEVWAVMDEQGLSQNDAKIVVAARYAKAEEQPTMDKMVKESRNKGVTNV
jgi:hypothetical protein